ncbi:MAG TPA: hypothetical protein O0X70_04495 [Methanocorpusculum sp.]|nr:hypothetical protein [Methanocorpusculum sp.]
MYIQQTADDIKKCLLEAGNLVDFAQEAGVSRDNVLFYEYMQACDMAKVYRELAAECDAFMRRYCRYLLAHPNENFHVADKSSKMVDLAKLRELRPDVYNRYKKLPDNFFNRRFTPDAMIQIMLANNVGADEIEGRVTVTVTDIQKCLSDEEKDVIFVTDPGKLKLVISEVIA